MSSPDMSVAFAELQNDKHLVLMRIMLPFAPFDVGQLAGFPPDEAERLYKLNAAIPADKNGQPLMLSSVGQPPPVKPKRDETVIIPANWREMHRLQRVKLAKEIAGTPEASFNVEQADGIIAAEETARGE